MSALKSAACSSVTRRDVLSFARDNILGIFVSYAVLIGTFAMCVLHNVVTFDAEGLYTIQDGIPWYHQWVQLGRWNLVLLKKLFGVSAFNPFFCTTMFLLLFPLSALLWAYLFQEQMGMGSALGERGKRLQFTFFCVVYIVQPVWALQFGYRNQMDAISFVLVLMPLAIMTLFDFLERPRALSLSVSVLLSVACFGSYQAFIFLYIAAVAACLLLLCWQWDVEGKGSARSSSGDADLPRQFWRSALWSILVIVVSYALNTAVSHLALAHYGLQADTYYLGQQFMWGKRPFTENLTLVLSDIGGLVFGTGVGGTAWYVISFVVLALLIVKNKERISHPGVYVLDVVGLFLTPFLLKVVTAGMIVGRSQFAYVLVLAFVTSFDFGEVLSCSRIGLRGRVVSPYLIGFLCLLGLFAVIPTLNETTRLMYTQMRVLDQDYSQMQAIYYEALQRGAKEGDAVCFVGSKADFQDDSMLEYEQMGNSYLEIITITPGKNFSVKTAEAMRAFGLQVSVPSDEQQHEADQIAQNMGTWPSPDGISVSNGIIVVRLQ